MLLLIIQNSKTQFLNIDAKNFFYSSIGKITVGLKFANHFKFIFLIFFYLCLHRNFSIKIHVKVTIIICDYSFQ